MVPNYKSFNVHLTGHVLKDNIMRGKRYIHLKVWLAILCKCTHHTVELHDTSCLWVDGCPTLVPGNQVQCQQSVPIVNLTGHKQLQLLQLILHGHDTTNTMHHNEQHKGFTGGTVKLCTQQCAFTDQS